MEILSSVGRRQGRNSQNRVADQQIVQSLLNQIPSSQGGASGSLNEQTVDGVCSDRLFEAIMRFQRTHLGARADGHIDPHGPTLRILNRLAEQSAHHRPSIQVLADVPISPLRSPQAGPALGDGGAILNDPVSRGRTAWNRFVNDVRDALRANPNSAMVMAYLTRVEQSAGANAPTIREWTAFGYASTTTGGFAMRNAHVLTRGTSISTNTDRNVVLLAPPSPAGSVGGRLIRLEQHTSFVLLGRNEFQATGHRETASDTGLERGELRNHLGRLAGRR